VAELWNNTVLIIEILSKAVPESMFWLTDICWNNTSRFQEAACVLRIWFLEMA
jgi:hypothetical protein